MFSHKSGRENQKHVFYVQYFFSLENRAVCDNVEKCGWAKVVADNMAHVRSMLN